MLGRPMDLKKQNKTKHKSLENNEPHFLLSTWLMKNQNKQINNLKTKKK